MSSRNVNNILIKKKFNKLKGNKNNFFLLLFLRYIISTDMIDSFLIVLF
jgi:hypothetical protein